ncbi:acetyl-CoA synthetase-like protein [Epithele typhae]|uniref:acetyl-CoA synthetase-like protein n=1 Tax=Epithele typhae TaxID=378194 RepID=UPI002008355C|nr:acetyl-CoA synthetase-like protein [Epithele typhae]KAH9915161.1 acetyl-CoA synthetase-like protein [Epithele typhae]
MSLPPSNIPSTETLEPPESDIEALVALGTDFSLPSEVTHSCLHRYFEDVARIHTDLPALAFDVQGLVITMSYGEMNRRCEELAHYLASTHAVGPGVMVPLFFTRGIDMIVAIFSVLKTGAAYVPLDIEHPTERTTSIVDIVGAQLVLTESLLLGDLRHRLQEEVNAIAIDALPSLPDPVTNFCSHGAGEDIAYVIFTSGTTGTPKGVAVHHTAAVSAVIDGPRLNRGLRSRNDLRMFLPNNYAFDFTIWDIFIPLTSGGCLCIATKEDMFDDINAVLRRLRVNVIMSTPTVLSLIEPSQVPTLDTMCSGGEMLTVLVRDRAFAAGLKLGNVYGPTEAAVCCVFAEVDPALPDPAIIGRPFGANRAYVLDEDLRLVPRGAVGTLWTAGPQVSKGYLGRPDLTAATFRPDPFVPGERMYNTGDLVAWTESGNLKCYGRADQQVKVRGQRIEILEIETTMAEVRGVQNACVVKRARGGREDLVGFYSPEPGTDVDVAHVEGAIMLAVQRKLPVYMHPSALVHLGKLPATVNGKADRRLLGQWALDLPLVTENVATTEATVAECWAKILKIPVASVPIDRPFYQCGGDSISIIHLAAALRVKGFDVKTSDLRKATTVKAQSRLTMSSTHAPLEQSYLPLSLMSTAKVTLDDVAELTGWEKDSIEDVYPCTPSVAGLVSLATTNPQSYLAQHAFRRAGRYKADALCASWKTVVAHHPILRTAFVIPPAPATDILQVVQKSDALEMSWTFHSAVDDAALDSAVTTYLESSRRAGFRIGAIPTRVGLFEGPTSSVMVLQVHHSQYDGWTLPIILENLQKAYHSIVEGITRPHTDHQTRFYAEFVQWTLQQDTDEALSFWRSELEDATLLSWPKVPHDAADVATDMLVSAVWTPPGLSSLASFCQDHNATPSSLIRLALSIVLGMHANSDDVLFGIVASGRSVDLPGIEDVVGPCITTLPCRVRLPPDASLATLLTDIQSRSSATASYEYSGLADIIRTSPFSRSRSIFQVLLTVENIPELDLHAHPLFGEDIHGHQMEMNYALGVTVFPLQNDGGLKFDIEYDSRHLSAADVRWFQTHLLATLDAILRHPTSTLANLDIVSDEERAFLQNVGIGLAPDPTLAAEPLVHRLIEKTAVAHPERVAVEHSGGRTLTYAELDALADRVAHGLVALGVRHETPVPVLFDKDGDQTEAVVAIVALMKAGAAFVPIDVGWPAARVAACVRQCEAPFVVCDGVGVPEVAHGLGVPVRTVGELARGRSHGGRCVVKEQTPQSLAYIIFTSGSTGEPKGVMIEHRNIMGYVANGTTVYPIQDVKRLLHFSPFSFDQGLGDIFMALTKGATLVLANMADVLTDLSEVLNSTRADYTVLTPAITQLIRADVDHPHLKSLLVGGEKLPGQLVDRWKGKVAFMDDYGPTEVTVSCVGMTFTADTNVPAGVIGSPYGDTRAYIVDPRRPDTRVPVGAVGELCLSGNQVGRGYLGRPDLTAAAFVPDPFAPGLTMYRSNDRARWTSDGLIEYLGRQDDAFVKLRGLRIDPGESEARSLLLELRGQPHLVAFVSKALAPAGEARLVLLDPENADADADGADAVKPWLTTLIDACRQAVPTYAVPTVWLALAAMPQNANSKFDHKQLRRFWGTLEPARIEAVSTALTQTHAPRTPEGRAEQLIARVWADVLARDAEALSVHDDFFALGGDSIGVVRMLAGLKAAGVSISLKDFGADPTVVALAARIDEAVLTGTSSPQSSDSGLPGVANGLAWQVQMGDVDESAAPLWLIHDGGGLGNEYENLGPLSRSVYAVSNPTSTLAELEAQFPTFSSYCGRNPRPHPRPRRAAAGLPVHGVVLLDSYNSEGWRRALFPARCDFPVLLVRAGASRAREEIEKAGFVVPYARGQRGRALTVGWRDRCHRRGADHYSLMRDRALCAEASKAVDEWLRRQTLASSSVA